MSGNKIGLFFLTFTACSSENCCKALSKWECQPIKRSIYSTLADFLLRISTGENRRGWKTSCLAQPNLTCNVSIVFLQLMSLHPLVPTLLVDVHFMVIRANGNLLKEEIKQSNCTEGFLIANAIFGKTFPI